MMAPITWIFRIEFLCTGLRGTSLRGSAGTINSETVWNDGANGGASGGGISGFFAKPTWQGSLNAVDAQGKFVPLTQRGVPDVAGNADPQTGYEVRVDGSASVIGGTSAVAPLWAALIARVNQLSGKPAGFLIRSSTKTPRHCAILRQATTATLQRPRLGCLHRTGSPNGAALRSVI